MAKEIRLINANELPVRDISLDTSVYQYGVEKEDIDKAETINAIVIPKEATVGDMIQKMFPKAEIHLSPSNEEKPEEYCVVINDIVVFSVWKAWWELPFSEYRNMQKAHRNDKYFNRR